MSTQDKTIAEYDFLNVIFCREQVRDKLQERSRLDCPSIHFRLECTGVQRSDVCNRKRVTIMKWRGETSIEV